MEEHTARFGTFHDVTSICHLSPVHSVCSTACYLPLIHNRVAWQRLLGPSAQGCGSCYVSSSQNWWQNYNFQALLPSSLLDLVQIQNLVWKYIFFPFGLPPISNVSLWRVQQKFRSYRLAVQKELVLLENARFVFKYYSVHRTCPNHRKFGTEHNQLCCYSLPNLLPIQNLIWILYFCLDSPFFIMTGRTLFNLVVWLFFNGWRSAIIIIIHKYQTVMIPWSFF